MQLRSSIEAPSEVLRVLAALPSDSPGTWKLIGVALIVAAIVGGGLTFFDIKFPVLKKYWQHILLGTAGIVALGYGWQLDKFRLSKYLLELPANYVGPCPGASLGFRNDPGARGRGRCGVSLVFDRPRVEIATVALCAVGGQGSPA